MLGRHVQRVFGLRVLHGTGRSAASVVSVLGGALRVSLSIPVQLATRHPLSGCAVIAMLSPSVLNPALHSVEFVGSVRLPAC